MRLLLDTHILIWWHESNPRLTKKMRNTIVDANEVYVSMASLWEMAIKLSSKRFKLSISRKLQTLAGDFTLLDVNIDHAQQVMELPWFHRDPFDRMLIAQAQSEDLYLVTDDAAVLRYNVKRIEI